VDVASCKLVADVAVVAGDHVLLVRYRDTARYDGEAGWFLPDDYLARLEHPDETARRILREQAGIDAPDELRLAEIETFNGDAWHMVFHYLAPIAEPVPAGGANVADARWFPLGDLPDPGETAHHGWALDVLGRILAVPASG
jgi:ADP-ribose pyrophosphatase YjhB (NUDIX family)